MLEDPSSCEIRSCARVVFEVQMARSPHEVITDFLPAMASNDRPILLEVLAEDMVWHTPPSTIPEFRGPHRGRAAALELIGGAGRSLFVRASQRVEIEHVIAEGELAAAGRESARGLAFGDERALAFRDSVGGRRHALEEYRLDRANVHDVFRFYLDRFDIPVCN